jgi:hypothetical protein
MPALFLKELYIYFARSSYLHIGRAIAQAVIPRLPPAAARVRAQAKSFGISGGQSGTGAGLLRVLRFPQSILIPLTAPHSL